MPKTHGMGRGKGPRPKSKQMYEEQGWDGDAARNLIVLSEMANPKDRKWKRINKNNPMEIWNRFRLFCDFCAQNGNYPNWTGFCAAMGYSKSAIYDMINGGTRISEDSLELLKRLHLIFETNTEDLAERGKINTIFAIFKLKATNPQYWAVESTRNSNISVNMNIGNGQNPEQLRQKFLGVIDVPYVEKGQEPCNLSLSGGTRDLTDAQRYNDSAIDGQLYAQEEQ